MATVEGSLLVAAGRRIDQYAWTGSKLIRIAFHDTAVEVTSLASIKSFLLYGDALKGLHFLQAAPGSRQLTQISKVHPLLCSVPLVSLHLKVWQFLAYAGRRIGEFSKCLCREENTFSSGCHAMSNKREESPPYSHSCSSPGIDRHLLWGQEQTAPDPGGLWACKSDLDNIGVYLALVTYLLCMQDYSNADVSASGTIVAGGKLGLACGDAGGTVRLFAYAQSHPQMWRGKRLLPLYVLESSTSHASFLYLHHISVRSCKS